MWRLFFILTLAASAAFAQAQEVIKIGVILPLTGNNAEYGELCRNGVRFFEHELNARMEKGELKNRYQIILEDDQLLPRMTAEALNKLVNIDHVQAIISTTGGSGSVIQPRAEQAQILHICVTTNTNVAKGTYNFTHWTPPQAEAPLLMEIIKGKGFKRVAIINQRHQGMLLMVDCIKAELKKLELEPVYQAEFNPGERDFRMILAKMQEAKPDLILAQGFSPEMGILMRQKKQLGIETPTTSLEMFDFIGDKELSEGLYMVSGAAETPEFAAKLKAFMPEARTTYSGYFYDSLSLLVDAFEKNPGSNLDRSKWLEQIKDYPSAVGNGKLSMGTGHIFWTTAAYYFMKDGKMEQTSLEEILKK